ncbi:unnamed protein product, partial [Rotaria sp. Silwood1]
MSKAKFPDIVLLLHTNEHFNLNNEIQQFCIQLLVELSSKTMSQSNCSTKSLRIALIDLIFVLLTKQKIQKIELKLPKQIQDLFITINVIIALTDQTKQTLLPEDFLQQSNDILGNNIQLNQDDFKKCNNDFNTISDQDLINLMNNDQSLNDSLLKFIENLSIESQSNST